MENSPASSSPKFMYGIITAILTWFAWITQWCITSFGFVDFISFFTVQCNLLVAVCLSFSLLAPATAAGKFFSRNTIQAAIALYIFIVGLVYNTVLRGLNDFSGMQWLIDNLMHVVVPVMFVVYWFIFTPRSFLQWKECIYWLIYPLVYTLYSMIRGAFVHWYPYPFLNADILGYPKVFVNMLFVLAAFLVAGIILIAIKRNKTVAGREMEGTK